MTVNKNEHDFLFLLLGVTKVIAKNIKKNSFKPSQLNQSDLNSYNTIKQSITQTKVVNDYFKDVSSVFSQLNSSKSENHLNKSSTVPSSRSNRLMRLVGLAASMTVDSLSELTKRKSGFSSNEGSIWLSEPAVEKMVETLSRMRGAALKLGQMISIQEFYDESNEKNNFKPNSIEKIFERVRNAAHYIPFWQTEQILIQNYGATWREKFESFDEKPVAAASIGQVHKATINIKDSDLSFTSIQVAVKLQYPGVAKSIHSDLNNLKTLLLMSRLLPKGLFLENTIKIASKELAWEIDYLREANYTEKFRNFLAKEKTGNLSQYWEKLEKELGIFDFQVPIVFRDFSTQNIIVTEWIDGVSVVETLTFPQEIRNMIGTSILYLCLKEIFIYKLMQSDPNWSNFLIIPPKSEKIKPKICLLDFGAAKEYSSDFVQKYLNIVLAAADQNEERALKYSIDLGFLTGLESEAMKKAHLASVIAVGIPFRESNIPFDFSLHKHLISNTVKANIPIMAEERLRPPPDDSYSLHRKLSGAFLLCAKLKAHVYCRKLLNSVVFALSQR